MILDKIILRKGYRTNIADKWLLINPKLVALSLFTFLSLIMLFRLSFYHFLIYFESRIKINPYATHLGYRTHQRSLELIEIMIKNSRVLDKLWLIRNNGKL